MVFVEPYFLRNIIKYKIDFLFIFIKTITDIDLQKINKYIKNHYEIKNLCFLREAIIDMNYGPGSHYCNPKGKVIYSSNVYVNKHMSTLGLQFLINKQTKRYERNEKMRLKGLNTHYMQDIDKIKEMYKNSIKKCNILV